MTTISVPEQRAPSQTVKAALQVRKMKPVKWWAVLGALSIAVQVYAYSHWIFVSGEATASPHGSTPVPTYMVVSARIFEVAATTGVVLAYWFWIIRPWIRDRRITSDGMLIASFAFVYWQDPIVNYTQNYFVYNSVLFDFGTWTSGIPGWSSPRGNFLAECPLFAGSFYISWAFMAVVVANIIMRRAQARWPQMGKVGLVGVCFAYLAIFDFVTECLMLRLGLFSWPGAIRSWSLFAGHYYQFPIYEPFLLGVWWTTLACFRYFRDDKGRTVAERGVDQLKTTERSKGWVRFLAIVGAQNAMLLLLFNVPAQWFGVHADPWPEDVLERSYLTTGICGPGTTYSCSDPAVPIPRGDSSHVSPSGALVGGKQ